MLEGQFRALTQGTTHVMHVANYAIKAVHLILHAVHLIQRITYIMHEMKACNKSTRRLQHPVFVTSHIPYERKDLSDTRKPYQVR